MKAPSKKEICNEFKKRAQALRRDRLAMTRKKEENLEDNEEEEYRYSLEHYLGEVRGYFRAMGWKIPNYLIYNLSY